MSSFSSRVSRVALVAGVLLSTPLAGRGQFVTDVNGFFDNGTYTLFCCPSNRTVTHSYPTSALIEDDYTATTGGAQHANRYDLRFSSNGGSSAREFDGSDSFDVSFDVKLEAGANTPRKEAGLIIDQSIGGSQFIVNSDAGEIVVFGGFQPFYSFNANHGISYTPGETINMRMIYNGKTATTPGNFQYIVKENGITYSSPVINSDAGEMGIADNSQLLLYLQGKAASAADFARVTYSNIVFGTGNAIPGDYNNNGVVDAGDYVVWRKGGTLANDPTPGVQPADYDFWRARFGNPAGSGSALSSSAVPEPSAIVLVLASLLAGTGLIRRR